MSATRTMTPAEVEEWKRSLLATVFSEDCLASHDGIRMRVSAGNTVCACGGLLAEDKAGHAYCMECRKWAKTWRDS